MKVIQNCVIQPVVPMPMDEAVRRLKAELISPDWRLTGSRITLLEAALGSLRHALASRRDAVAVVTMAENVLHYIERHQALDTYVLIAFLKEAMALAVSLHEEAAPDQHQDARTFRAVYQRFQAVKSGLQGRGMPRGVGSSPWSPSALPQTGDLELDLGEDGVPNPGEKQPGLEQVVAGLARDVQALADRVEAQGVLLERLLAKLNRMPPG